MVNYPEAFLRPALTWPVTHFAVTLERVRGANALSVVFLRWLRTPYR